MALRLCACIIAAVLALAAGPLQARPLQIVAIGASNTTGFGVGEQNAYPAVLERLLPQGRRCACHQCRRKWRRHYRHAQSSRRRRA